MKNSHRITPKGRLLAGLIFTAAIAVLFLLHWVVVDGKINIAWLFGPCGFKEKYGLPCPTCGMTTALVAFLRGEVFRAFYIQPAAALFCCAAVAASVLPLLIAVFGTDFGLSGYFVKCKMKYLIIGVLIIIASAWAVTLARTLVQNN